MPPEVSAPVSAPVATPTSSGVMAPTSGPNAGIPSTGDIFAELDRKLGMNEPTQDLSKAKMVETRPGTLEDLMNLGEDSEEAVTEAAPVATDSEATESVEAEPEAAPVNYRFKNKVGDKDYDFEIKSQEHLDRIVKKAIASDTVWKDHQALQREIAPLREAKAYMDRFESMLDENPANVLGTIADEMPEEALKDWLISKAQELSQPKEQRDIQKKLKQAELLERKFAALEAREAEMEQRRVQQARESDKKAVDSWQETWRQKLSAKVPEQYVDLVNDQLYNSLREAKERRSQGETVSLKTLDQIFAKKMRPVLALIDPKGGMAGQVDREVGKAMDSKRQQNLSRVQQMAASQARPAQTKTKMQQMLDKGDMSGIFDAFAEGVGSGRIKFG